MRRRVREEAGGGLTCRTPDFFSLYGSRSMQRESPTNMARIRMLVVNDHVALRIRQVLAPTGKPFASAVALQARPLPINERAPMVLLQERAVGGQRRAEGRPVMLLGTLTVVRLSPAAALEACIVFPKMLNVMTLGSPNLF